MTTGPQVWQIGRPTGPAHGPRPLAEAVGWVLRTARLLSADPAHATLERMARAVGSNPTRLHRLETGALRDGQLTSAYERVLGVPAGLLVAPADIVARSHRGALPEDTHPPAAPTSVREVSRLTDDLASGAAPDRGGAWLSWARALSQPGAVGLRESDALSLLDGLAGELGRAVGAAYPRRYEALSLMRRGPYGGLVLEVARQRVAAPGVQVLHDLMSAVAEMPDDQVLGWALQLLRAESRQLAEAGALTVENLSLMEPAAGFWARVAPQVVQLLDELEPGSHPRTLASHLLRLAPRQVGRSAVQGLRAPLEAPGPVEAGDRPLREHLSERCRRIAEDAAVAAGLPPDQPVLASLVFDIALSPLEARGVSAYMLVSALPQVTAPLAEGLASLAEEVDRETVRARLVRRLAGARWGWAPSRLDAWWGGPEPLPERAMVLAGHAGVAPPDEVVTGALAAGGVVAQQAVGALALSGSARLAGLVDDPAIAADVRAAADWWSGEGPRVTDPA